jgi:hypothetical protein
LDTKDAFDAICGALLNHPDRRLIDARYFDEIFGNFIIDFEEEGRPRSIVNDRFELVLGEGFGGNEPGATVLRSLRDADEKTILDALKL